MSTTKWIIDPTHSEVSFKVKHLVISTVTGYFREFEGAAETESDDFSNATIHFSAAIDSIDTNQKDRNAHLKSADFFDAENHPQLVFSNGRLEKREEDFAVTGELTIRGTTQPITLKAELGGIAQDGYGQTKAGFELEGKISRKAFGLTWSAVTETGSVVVGDEVKIFASIQLVKQ
ncbi:YceI family protein [Cyclobacterium jeungdonense]|uniref:YceI family protein n=1 Tax=Cyclobacterium jeungdonense TaxID=708087 RepID=A0ABT8C3K8_9BACT|nr:YceI family protein [Cyclobacterium jeungdonense]MDN3686957.1 YceI family protein [Cyclobacterium jeungdonense]